MVSCSGSSEHEEVQAETVDTIIDTYDERLAEIEKFTKELKKDSLKLNVSHASSLISAYDAFITNHPVDDKTPEFTFKAADLSRGLKRWNDAVKYFNDIIDNHSKSEYAAMSLFYKAMILGDNLNDVDQAKALYEEFIEKYPDHEFADDAKASIDLLGMSLEDVIKQFEENKQ